MIFNPLDLTGKRYLVTGAASGLGKATAILLSKLGAELVLVDINENGITATQTLCHERTIKLPMDLMSTHEIKDKINQVVADYGKLNGIAHIAGRPYISPLKSISEKTSNDVYMLNTYAAIELSKVFTNKKNCVEGDASIVLISSVYGLVGSGGNVGYAMSKAALHGITKSLAIELAPKRIRVNCIAPGFIKTEMLEGVSNSFNNDYDDKIAKLHPLGLGEAQDVAGAIAYLFSDMSKWVTGSIMSVDGGFTAQ
jgi:NAD(P)-dependent dehydrogenase (short-subunit alcohol dehydrogenase family)